MGTLPFEAETRNIIFRKEADTNPNLGCNPAERKTEDILNYGIVNIDKPKGPTSHMVSDYVQKILHIDKAGHSGTLDPAVTGVLPTALGRGTRIVSTLLSAGKEYIAIMHLHEGVDEKILKKTIDEHFLGPIRQMPPIKSAVKRQWRTRSVYYLDILEIEGQDVLFKVGTEAGTYIRKLIHDIGQKLKIGAHMAELRRTKAGPFTEETAFTMHEITDAYYFWKEEQNDKFLRKVIQPVENGTAHLKKIWVFDTTVDSMCHGSDLKVPGISKLHDSIQKDDAVAIMTLKNELVALGKAQMTSADMIKERGIAATTDKVFMLPGIYKTNN